MPDQTKPTVVLIPGLGNTGRLWHGQRKALEEIARVIVPDLRGSESIDQMAKRVLEQSPAGPLSLVGFSLGGYVAFDILRQSASRVDRLALISCSPYTDTRVAAGQRAELIEKAKDGYADVLRGMAAFVVFGAGPRAPETREALISMGNDLGAEEFCLQQRVAMERQDCCEILANIRVPTRVICGSDDPITPASHSRYLAENIPEAGLTIVDNAGHLLPLERPDEINAFLLDWLNLPAH